MIEIRIHGSGGQGVVIAGKLLANAAAKSNFQVQSFAAYGAERRGGKVTSYVRLSKAPIHIHSKMYAPDYIVLMDEALVEDAECLAGLNVEGRLLINSPKLSEEFGGFGDMTVAAVDANRIAIQNGVRLPNGMPIINTTLLGALVGTLTDISLNSLIEAFKEAKVPAIDSNIQAATEAFHCINSRPKNSPSLKAEPDQIIEQRCPEFSSLTPPCENACPVGHVIHKTLALVRKNRFTEALENIKMENPFPGICGRVCFHPCENSCNAKDANESLAINALERAVFDHADKDVLKKPLQRKPSGKKVAVIGSGPAGMSCAYFLVLLGHNPTVFEAQAIPGGIPRMGIPAYRLPKSVVDKEVQQILGLGVNIKTNTRIGREIAFEDILKAHEACFIATGAQRSMRLNIPGEKCEGVIPGLEFLKRIASGDAVNLSGFRVAVVGGGNTAIDAARSAIRLKAKEVFILYRRTVEQMPAYQAERRAAEQEGVRTLYLTTPVSIHQRNSQAMQLECLKTRLGKPGNDGRRRSKIVAGTNFMLEVNRVVTAIGETPDISYIPAGIKTVGSRIEVDALGRTSIQGVYAGGDLSNVSWNVTEAIGSGKRAAIGIDLFLRNGEIRPFLENMRKVKNNNLSFSRYFAGDLPVKDVREATAEDLNLYYFTKTPRTRLSELDTRQGVLTFDEINAGQSRQQAIAEATRCFHCGNCNFCGTCYILCPDAAIACEESFSSPTIDSTLCKRCRICIHECPRGLIA